MQLKSNNKQVPIPVLILQLKNVNKQAQTKNAEIKNKGVLRFLEKYLAPSTAVIGTEINPEISISPKRPYLSLKFMNCLFLFETTGFFDAFT